MQNAFSTTLVIGAIEKKWNEICVVWFLLQVFVCALACVAMASGGFLGGGGGGGGGGWQSGGGELKSIH